MLRSRSQSGQAIGAMITASHNPGPDNGVKLVDPAGEMLEAAWEGVATQLANCDDAKLAEVLAGLVARLGIAGEGGSVIVGRDTRVSSPSLSEVRWSHFDDF